MFERCGAAFGAVLAILGLAAGAMVPVEAALPRARDGWNRVDGDGFEIVGDAQAALMREVALRFGRLRALVPAVLGVDDPDAGRPLRVFVFAHERTFRPYANGREGDVSGMFVRGDGARYLLVHATPPLDPHAILAHEYLHYVLDESVPALPLWFDEGLAELFSTFRADPVRAEIGLPNARQRSLLVAEGPIAASKFLAIGANSPEYLGGALKELYHAQAWATVHAAVVGSPRGLASLADFLGRVRSGQDAREAFATAFGTAVETVVQNSAAYAASEPWVTASVDLGPLPGDAEPRVRPMTYAETLARLGDLLAHGGSRSTPSAAKHFDRALRLDPRQPIALAGVGSLRKSEGAHAEAAAAFDRAQELAPDDAVLAYRSARNLMQWVETDLRAGREPDPEMTARIESARRRFRIAIARDPTFVAAHVGLGASYLFDDPSAAEAADALDRARELSPFDPDVRFTCALLAVRCGRWEVVRAELDALWAAGVDPSRVRFVRNALDRADLEAARRNLPTAAAAQDAVETLRRLRSSALSPAVRREASEVLAEWGSEDPVSDLPHRP